LINTTAKNIDEVVAKFPHKFLKEIAEKEAKFYVVDAN
jgi:hypothetical protein